MLWTGLDASAVRSNGLEALTIQIVLCDSSQKLPQVQDTSMRNGLLRYFDGTSLMAEAKLMNQPGWGEQLRLIYILIPSFFMA